MHSYPIHYLELIMSNDCQLLFKCFRKYGNMVKICSFLIFKIYPKNTQRIVKLLEFGSQEILRIKI